MCWNPPDPSDFVDQQLASNEDEQGIQYLYLPDGDPYEILVFHPDRSPEVEEFWTAEDFNARLDELKQANAEYEILFGPEEIPF